MEVALDEPTGAVTPPATTAPGTTPPSATAPRTVQLSVDRIGGLVVAVLLVALVAFGVDRLLAVRHGHQADADRSAALTAAKREVVALTTVSASTSSADIDRLLAGATKTFKAQFQDQAEAFRNALQEGEVTSTGRVASAGITSLKGGTATVLVAATGTVKNKDTTKAEARNYRLRVTLRKTGSHWLVSALDFVA